MKRTAVFTLLVLTALTLAPRPSAVAADGRPNIVLILADDLGISDLGCYGRHEHRTPRLDRLASQGIRFTSAYAAQPICSPSRAALMTGQSPARLHLTNYLPGRPDADSQKLIQPRMEGQLPLEEATLAELLRDAGYATGLFGKWHLGGRGFDAQQQGFDVVEAPAANPQPIAEAGGKGEFAITVAAEAFIEAYRDGPFFCYVPHNNPHIPLAAGAERIERHREAFHPVYAAMIETLDEAVGRLLDKLDALGLAERTIVIFTSDNGGLHVLESPGTPATHNRPFRAGKGYVYEGGLRVPLIVRWPGVTPVGKTSDEPLLLSDLMPTLLKAAGIDAARTVGPLDGVDATELLRGNTLPERPLYWHFPHYTNQGGRPAGAVRVGPWKLIEHYEDDRTELYHLPDDIGEEHNLSAASPERADQLARQLRDWRQRVGAQMPVANGQLNAALHRRLYVEQDSSQLMAQATAAATAPAWTDWRREMNAAVKGRSPRVTPSAGDVRLHACDARVRGSKLRYEPEPNKNVLGYWTEVGDWAEWEFEAPAAGAYEVEVQQGCGTGSGGAEVDVQVAGQTLTFVVQETGHFQSMILRMIGKVRLPEGKQTLAVRPRTKPGPAVMDIRRVVLRPAE